MERYYRNITTGNVVKIIEYSCGKRRSEDDRVSYIDFIEQKEVVDANLNFYWDFVDITEDIEELTKFYEMIVFWVLDKKPVLSNDESDYDDVYDIARTIFEKLNLGRTYVGHFCSGGDLSTIRYFL